MSLDKRLKYFLIWNLWTLSYRFYSQSTQVSWPGIDRIVKNSDTYWPSIFMESKNSICAVASLISVSMISSMPHDAQLRPIDRRRWGYLPLYRVFLLHWEMWVLHLVFIPFIPFMLPFKLFHHWHSHQISVEPDWSVPLANSIHQFPTSNP